MQNALRVQFAEGVSVCLTLELLSDGFYLVANLEA